VRTAILLSLTLLVWMPLRAEARPTGDIAEIASKLDDDDTVEKTYAALSAQHYARRHWGFQFFSHTELRDWQLNLAPLIPKIVELLAEGEKLEWVDATTGNQTQVTTPRKEAGLALLAIERASVEPLLAALDSPKVAPHADEVLRRIVRGGPPEHDHASWRRWWDAHRTEPLHNERGQWWLLALGLVALGGVGTLVFRRQRAQKS
jgi:LPXTG-motif cell wall-anchored protein